MIKNLAIGTILILLSTVSFAQVVEFKECRVSKISKFRFFDDRVDVGAVAVFSDGQNIVLKDILGDAMIHFKTVDGKITDHYHWMYSLINKVQNRDDKYLSSSYGEDVILTIGEFTDKPGQTTVKYVGTRSGEYLTMTCE